MQEETTFGENTDIELNPKSVREKQDAYTSLTDLYGVEVFTNQFMETAERERVRQEQETAGMISRVFKEIYGKDAGEDGLADLLFREESSQILMKEYNDSKQKVSVFHICMVMAAVLGVLLLYRIFWRGKN